MTRVLNFRNGLGNAFERFRKTNRGSVCFLGGSITEMNGYTAHAESLLRKLFPACRFRFVNAGISSTCSDTGAYRLERDVLAVKPDLLFVEFAVNDNQDGHFSFEHGVRAMEGIVRRFFTALPESDIVFLFTANESHNKTFAEGTVPHEIRAHEAVAEHYGIPSADFAFEVARSLKAGKFSWETFGGCHPAPFGNALYGRILGRLFRSALKNSPLPAKHVLPEPLSPFHLGFARLADCSCAETDSSWKTVIPDWERIPGVKRDLFTSIPMLCSDKPGAELRLRFSGTAAGVYLTAGPDAGILECSIDGAPFRCFDTRHPFSAGLHYPYTLTFSDSLPAEIPHELMLRISDKKNPASSGRAVRIMAFALNG